MASPDRRTRVIRPARAALAVLCAALLYGGCAGNPAADTPAARAAPAAPAAPDTPLASIEEIAAAIGCTAELSVEAEELRQGGCQAGQNSFRMATFAADRGLRDWLTEAQAYGGTYLVGNRWVVTAPSTEALTTLRERLGGSLESGSAHTAHPADPPDATPSGSPTDTPTDSPTGSPSGSPTGSHSGH
ncbi:hypothetical protein [Streptomyces sp. NBC_01408]|uniref:hypothetical protein n=1 Tax=Streptomyces sp. NBC_01408 TaxID=2903855 RepID=UPI00225B2BB2|nr:hypothetical protein [Streptomyces sp. NBC_01408]MCX4695754.1 PT domain-containing protein [Streptomyces sp. NBC_01408]